MYLTNRLHHGLDLPRLKGIGRSCHETVVLKRLLLVHLSWREAQKGRSRTLPYLRPLPRAGRPLGRPTRGGKQPAGGKTTLRRISQTMFVRGGARACPRNRV